MFTTRPGSRYLGALADALEVSVDILRREVADGYRRDSAGHVSGDGHFETNSLPTSQSVVVSSDLEDLHEVMDMLERRQFLKAAAAGMFPASLMKLNDFFAGSKVSAGAVESVAVATEHLAQRFDKFNYIELDRLLEFHLETVVNYLRSGANLRQQAELYRRGSQLAGLLGLSAFLQGRVEHAWRSYAYARSFAEEVGDRKLTAWIVSEEASMACYAGHLASAATLTQLAQEKLSGRAQLASLSSNAARAYSGMGRRSDAVSAIESTVSNCLDISDGENSDLPSSPIWGFSATSGLTRVSSSWLAIGNF